MHQRNMLSIFGSRSKKPNEQPLVIKAKTVTLNNYNSKAPTPRKSKSKSNSNSNKKKKTKGGPKYRPMEFLHH